MNPGPHPAAYEPTRREETALLSSLLGSVRGRLADPGTRREPTPVGRDARTGRAGVEPRRGARGPTATRRGARGSPGASAAARFPMVSVEPRGHVRPVVAPLSTDRADARQPFVGRPAPDRLRGDVQQARYLDGPEQLVILSSSMLRAGPCAEKPATMPSLFRPGARASPFWSGAPVHAGIEAWLERDGRYRSGQTSVGANCGQIPGDADCSPVDARHVGATSRRGRRSGP
jgi:hypothetical protein